MKFLVSIYVFFFSQILLANNDQSHYSATQILIPYSLDKVKKVEFYLDRPQGRKKLKTIIFIHGHQFPKRPGGNDYVKWGVLDKWKKRGYTAVAISQLGYGLSDE